MTTAVRSFAERSVADRLRGVHVGLREDLEVSRHVFRKAVSYVVRDPLTFQSQRLDLADYEIFVRIRGDRSLGDTFAELVECGKLEEEDEEQFYEFVLTLHRLSFLRLPVSDEKLLYRRYQLRQQARWKEAGRSILFLRIPIWNPSDFLDRTVRYVQPLMTRAAFAAWLVLVLTAVVVVVRYWHDLVNPLEGILAARNLPLMWITLVGLKVFHEFGHAYACRYYGGHVPEMGVYLILFTPCAYMDATASWGFSRKRERIIVCLAGMYVEAAIAAVAVFVWAATGPGLVNAAAHNIIFLASAVTVLFNINPLMRYDGYYVLSDLVEIPNLRQRSMQYVLERMKRLLLGLDGGDRGCRRTNAILGTYGASAVLYRAALMVAIAAILASKLFVLGVLMAVVLLGGGLAAAALKLTNYLWYAEETAGRRRRAVALSLAVFILLPAGVMWIPVPGYARAPGVLSREVESVVHAQEAGFLQQLAVAAGERVETAAVVARLENDQLEEQLARRAAAVRAARIRRDAFAVTERVLAQREEEALNLAQRKLAEARRRQERLTVRAACGGEVVQSVHDNDLGSFLQAGAPVAMIVSGRWQVRTIVSGEQWAQMKPQVSQPAEFRSSLFPDRVIPAEVVSVAPGGSRRIQLAPLTTAEGGDIAVDEATQAATEPYFEVTVALPPPAGFALGYGSTGYVRFRGPTEPVGTAVARRITRFWNRLLEG